jgi:S-adenosylmethionine uptake transporter
MNWAAIYGFLIFKETPDQLTLVGAGVIMASGLYIVMRESRGAVSKNNPVLQSRTRHETGTLPRISLLLGRDKGGK